jgi:hypothetical protein
LGPVTEEALYPGVIPSPINSIVAPLSALPAGLRSTPLQLEFPVTAGWACSGIPKPAQASKRSAICRMKGPDR